MPSILRLYMPILCALVFCGCQSGGRNFTISHKDMQDAAMLRWEKDSSVLIFSGNATARTKVIALEKGKYTIRFEATGNASEKTLPHFILKYSNSTLRDLNIEEGTKLYEFNFEVSEPMKSFFEFTFDNDFQNETGDRNIFIRFPVIIEEY